MTMSNNKNRQIEELRVSSNTDVKKTASCIASLAEEDKIIEITTIGAGALNQAQKSIIIAGSILASKGITVYERSSFTIANVEGEEKTAIKKRLIFMEG